MTTIPQKLTLYPSHEYKPKGDTVFSSWYSVSYLYYGVIGTCLTFVTGCVFSLVFRCCGWCEDDGEVDESLLFDYGGFFYQCLPSCVTDKVFERKPHVKVELDLNLMSVNSHCDDKEDK